MHKSRLFYLLKGLSPTEFKRFFKFIQSPFHCTNPAQIKLYQILKKYYPELESPKLDREKVYQKLYPGKKLNYHHFGNLMTEMTRLVEEFLIYLEVENEDFQKRKILVQALGRRNLYTAFEKGSKKLMNELERQEYHDTEYYREMEEIQSQYFFHPKTSRFNLDFDFPKRIMDNLDKNYFLSKMQGALELKTREKMLSSKYDIPLLDKVVNHCLSVFSEEEPLFFIYPKMLSLHNEQEPESTFFEVKEFFVERISNIRKKEQKDILHNLLNHAIRQINKGLFEYNSEAFDLYKIGLLHDLIVENKKIRALSFMNIAGNAGVLKEFDYAENFIENYSQYLDRDILTGTKALTLSELRFRQASYEEIIGLFSNLQFENIFLETQARFLLVKTWYEKYRRQEGLYDLLISKIEAFEKFLKRKDVLAEKRSEGNLNFLKMLKRIIRHTDRLNINPEIKNQMEKQVLELKPLIGKVWLNEKIREI